MIRKEKEQGIKAIKIDTWLHILALVATALVFYFNTVGAVKHQADLITAQGDQIKEIRDSLKNISEKMDTNYRDLQGRVDEQNKELSDMRVSIATQSGVINAQRDEAFAKTKK